jgi:uncharacterized membrane protein YfcA
VLSLASFFDGWIDLAFTFVALTVAYAVFGIAGFGSALIAAPLLVHKLPLTSVVPLLALLDFAAAGINGFKLRADVAKRELFWLVPLMIVGSIAGITLLISLPSRLMIFLLGLFVLVYGVRGLYARSTGGGKLGFGWVWPFGLIGGLVSGMFGSGGFIYSIFLSRRLQEKDAIRATQSVLIGLSTLTRVVIFAIVGTYHDLRLLLLALSGLPALLLGLYIGQLLTDRLSLPQFIRVLHFVLVATGCSLVWRAAVG